jgi:hypothetical protein
MAKAQKKPERQPIPFDDALRRILTAPPQHKEAPKKKKRRQKSKGS